MSDLPRYDTLVIKGATSTEVPREAAGGEVVAWSQGHALAEAWPLEEFVQAIADGMYDDIELLQSTAERVLELSAKQNQQGWIES